MRKFKALIKLAFIALVIILVFNHDAILKNMYPLQYEGYIITYSREYSVDPNLVAAVIKAESKFENKAVSHRGAYGLMQIMPDTADWIASQSGMGEITYDALYDPETNIKMGCWYLNNLSTEFEGDLDLMLAAYNGGRGNVQKWLKDDNYSKDGENLHAIPFKETKNYVEKVNKNYNMYKKIYDLK
ncbi:lytic transglycosylase domain-containing protein [Clostridium senegalense]|uniref:lytic transglycosylase domain-containing protein n=1 Tax=Clostridium senegalense TaxID=1465809 RepID=UPI0002890087|nr:lytic transglycosylase domain-containing protein [Clostridium senegalense]MBU5228347.1 lytic transglycosylase domain-containing protein [Clostridium senegalense]